jgi:hypothetical protein
MLFNTAIDPAPDNGRIINNSVSSTGKPKSLNIGEVNPAKKAETPLALKTSTAIKIVSRYGKTPATKDSADLDPSIK